VFRGKKAEGNSIDRNARKIRLDPRRDEFEIGDRWDVTIPDSLLFVREIREGRKNRRPPTTNRRRRQNCTNQLYPWKGPTYSVP